MKRVAGDILSVKKGVIIHQLNAKDKMGAGIALSIAKKYPEHLEDYNKMCHYTPNLDERMGKIVVTKVGELTIVGVVGQKDYGNAKKTGVCYTNYEALEKGFKEAGDRFNSTDRDVYFPERIGCELAGGDTSIVHELISKSFKNPILVEYEKDRIIEREKKVMVVDGMNLIHRSYYTNTNSQTKEGLFNGGILGFIRYVNRFIKSYNIDHMVVCLDDDGETFRHKLYEEYKATRSETPQELQGQFEWVEKYLELSNITFLKKEGYEADDLIGTISKNAIKYDYKALIVTGDKDLFQLVDDNTTVLYLYPKGSDIYKIKDITDRYDGITPEQFLDLKALMGDSSDNIPGVKGIGEKTGIKLLKDFGSLDGIYENIESISGKRKETLINEKELAYLSKELSKIKTDIDIDLDQLFTQRPLNNNTQEVLDLLNELEIKPEVVGLSDEAVEKIENKIIVYPKKEDIKILDCSVNGDKNFSEVFAQSIVDGEIKTIETHISLSKEKCKDKNYFCIGDKLINIKYLDQFYKLLWCKYLDIRQDLVEIASRHDSFTGGSEAKIIKQYVQEGRDSLMMDCKELICILTGVSEKKAV